MSLSEKTATALAVTRAARVMVPPYSVWRHKKGGTYRVLGHELDTETGTARVRYQRVAGPDYDETSEAVIHYSRPVEMWTPDRFTLVTDPAVTGRS